MTLRILRAGLRWIVPSTWLVAVMSAQAAEPVDYNRDIRPILSNSCYVCHGPDEAQRPTDLRLDVREIAFGDLESGVHAIVPGDSERSELYRRLVAEDPAVRMPPADSEKKISKEEIELIRRWIDEGAEWSEHWSFIPPHRPNLPAASRPERVENAIDLFVQHRLSETALSPTQEADKVSLLRRVTLDLTGLPPTLEEIDAFLADRSPSAYDRVVDRLLASAEYGEHMARYWLDAARYGDTHGLHLDNLRSIWPYREWVIRAFNENMPFDQFTVEQLAGDLLPTEPTLDQLVATGFNRCNVTTSEGGSIDQEYLVRYAVDRVETTATVWMGLTAGCAACHDHKYDPLTQKEFYKLYAYFFNLEEKAMDGNALLPPPTVKVPSPFQQAQLERITQSMEQLRSQLEAPLPEVDAAQAAWETEWSARLASRWQPLVPNKHISSGGATLRKLDDHSVLAEGKRPDQDTYTIVARTDLTSITAIRLEALLDDSLPKGGPGRADQGNFVLTEFELEASSADDPTQRQVVKFQSATADYSQKDFPIAAAIDGKSGKKNGWAVDGATKHEPRTAVFLADAPFGYSGGTVLEFRLKHNSQFTGHAIGRVRLSASNDASLLPISSGAWYTVGPFPAESGETAYTTDFGPESKFDLKAQYGEKSLSWTERPKFVDGEVHNLEGESAATYLARRLLAPESRQVTLSFGSDDALKVWLNGELIIDQNVQRGVAADQDQCTVDLQPGENLLLPKVVNYQGGYAFTFRLEQETAATDIAEVASILAKPQDQRTSEETKQLRAFYRRRNSPQWNALQEELAALEQQQKNLEEAIPASLIMRDIPPNDERRRDVFVLIRGQYDREDKDQPVTPGVPAALPPLPEGAPPNRLSLAQWLVNRDHPLTARVTVNRIWQRFFGEGLVKTAEDFGSQGEWPSHPELLDWLSVEFMESGWDVKYMVRLIVSSATYRQSSKVTPESLAADPENRLLARGPRFRMDAEMVRDHALAVSGLLVRELGGESVKPYQPAGLWEAVGYTNSNTAKFVQDHGKALYRRSMYTFWKRTSPPPTMLTFDAPSRESCTVRRARTNTPLQALALMNDVQFVEAARKFAERIVHHGGETSAERAEFAFRAATARKPKDDELSILLDIYAGQLSRFREDQEAAQQLLSEGESPRDESLDAGELAAWTMVANLILNLDETVTK